MWKQPRKKKETTPLSETILIKNLISFFEDKEVVEGTSEEGLSTINSIQKDEIKDLSPNSNIASQDQNVSQFNSVLNYDCVSKLYITVQNNKDRWHLLNDEFVSEIIQNGLKLKFVEAEKVNKKLVVKVINRKNSKEKLNVMENCITEFLDLNLISEIDNDLPIFPNYVFVVSSDTRTTKHRLILDMKVLNNYVQSEKFTMWNIEKLLPFISLASYTGVIDISKAYCHIPMHFSSLQYLAFSFKGKKFSYNCMPFGLKTAPYYFTRILKPVLGYLREKFLYKYLHI